MSSTNLLTAQDLRKIEQDASIIVREVGEHVKNAWGELLSVTYKDKRDVVTEVDHESEKILRSKLSVLLPRAGFLVEEGIDDEQATYNWTIDPIDGTKLFAFQVPIWYVQIALLENNEPVLGLIYNPVADQLFSASKGNGATLNNKTVLANFGRSSTQAIIDVDLGGHGDHGEKNMNIITDFYNSFYRVRLSSILYPYLVTGAIDGYVVLNPKTKVVDQAPRIILMREAGYKVDYVDLQGRKVLVAATETIYKDIEDIIRKRDME